MYVVALTGGIATGKSTVSNYLLKQGIPVIDTDLLSRKVVEPGEMGLKQVTQAFGPAILTLEGQLNRSKLGEIIFNNEEAKKQLNGILHPLIYDEVSRMLDQYRQAGQTLVFVDVPLLFEVNRDRYYDESWLVYLNADRQLERLMLRNNFSVEEAKARINSQLPIDEKVILADIVINNSGTREETYQQIDEQLRRIQGKI
ncbi:dephospho-CoA kinase [Fundicoccus culcitae]|uniref:Dephospho-CoA kinase n=1 Tax=Fundicoccus culcitae TaxID=2969821 RepID=A0ABY5P602_9LACT|nr:dephospho-CoA kinase [Fundicoccus culcitae]UUX34166.1 dephospho-CoA kinase [Fundicoccus culcitae]